MTESMIDLPGVIAKSDDSDFLRDLIQDAAQRLMDIEAAEVKRMRDVDNRSIPEIATLLKVSEKTIRRVV